MSDNIVMRRFRVLMADAEALMELAKNPSTIGTTAFILEAELPSSPEDARFVGVSPVPTVLDAFGGSAQGPVGLAFLVNEDSPTTKRYFISLSVDVPWGLPENIHPVPLGVTPIGGVLYGHFELVAPDGTMEQFIAKAQEGAKTAGLTLLLIKAKDYTPKNMMELLSTLKRTHGKG